MLFCRASTCADHKAGAADKAKLKEQLSTSLRVLGKAFDLDNRILVLEYWDAAPVIVKLYSDALQEHEN